MSEISGKAKLGEGCDKPVLAKDLKVGHKSFSYGKVVAIQGQHTNRVAVWFDSNHYGVFDRETFVK